MRRLRRIILYSLLAVVVLIAGATAFLTLTAPGRERLAAIASSLASSDEQQIAISGIDNLWAGPLQVGRVTLSDRDGAWLSLQGIETDVSYLALLGGTVSADRLKVDRIEAMRQPAPSQAEDTGGATLPIDIDIRAIDLPQIVVGPQLVGAPATLSATGRAKATASPLRIEGDIDVARTDGSQGDLSVKLAFAPDENRLDLSIEGAEPQGGVVANLLRLAGAPPMSIAVEGSGPASDWRGQGAIAVDETVVAKLAGRHQETAQGRRVELTGNGAFAPFVPQDLRALVDGDTRIDLAGTLAADGGIAVERAVLESSAVSVSADGQVDPQGASDFRMRAAARGAPVALAFGAGDDAVSLRFRSAEATVSGAGRTPAIVAKLALASLAAPQGELTEVGLDVSSTGFDVATRTGPVDARLSIGAVSTRIAGLAPYVAGEVGAAIKAQVEADRIAFSEASVFTDALSARASGELKPSDGSARILLDGDVAATTLPAAARGVLGERLAVAGEIVRAADGALSLDKLTAESGVFTAAGTATLARGQITAEVSGALAELGRVADTLAGAATFDVKASGSMLAPDVTMRIGSERIESGGRTITDLALTATGTVNVAAPQADVTLNGLVGADRLEGKGRLSTTGGRRSVEGLSLSLGPNSIAGDLSLDEAFLPQGTVTLAIPDLGPLGALAAQQVTGAANGTVSFTAGDAPSVTIDFTVPSFARGDLTGSDVSIAATVDDYVSAPAVAGRIRAASVNSGTTAITGVDVTLTRDGDWTGFDGRATAAGIPAQARGRARYEGGVATVELDAGQATVSGVTASVAERSTIVYRDGAARLQRATIGLGGGRAVIDGTAGETLALTAQLQAVPASLANSFAPGLGAAGTVTGTVRVTGAPASPSIDYDLRLAGAQTSQTRDAGFGAMAIQSTGTFAGGTLRFRATVGDGSGLTMQGGGSVATTGSRGLDLAFDGRVPFGFLTQRLAAQGLSLSGNADVSLTVGGSINAPVIGGSVRAAGARFIDAGSGIAIGDINADIGLGGGVATLRSLTGSISSGGTISASGTVGIDAGGGFPADLSVKVADARYADGRTVTSNFSGDIAVKGPLASVPTLSGTVNLGRTVITVPERLPASLSRLNVQHRNAPAPVRQQAEALRPATGGSSAGGLSLDLTVNAPQQIFVQGRGLDAELGGTLRLTGPVSSPSASGLFTMRRGRLDIIGRRLDFTSGTVGFAGSLVPALDFVATSSANNSTVTVTVAGPANNPAFTFTSSPAAPEDEVMAQLVFGRSVSNLSPVQIAQLATAAASLAGIGGTTSLLQSLQGKLGVDDIDVKTSDTGDTSVSVGKYLNDRTYITIEKGSQPGSGKAAIDLNVGRGLKLRGEAADDGSTKGGIFFEREY